MGSSVKGFGDPRTHKNIPKFVEEVTLEVIKADKVVELFQTMAIASMNIGNLTLEVNILKNISATREKEKEMI